MLIIKATHAQKKSDARKYDKINICVCIEREKERKSIEQIESSIGFYLLAEVCPYGVTVCDDVNADDAELNVPNGPILLNADDIKLVIPEKQKNKLVELV